jgi:hypothetical protein
MEPEHAINTKTIGVRKINRTGLLIFLSFLRGSELTCRLFKTLKGADKNSLN